MATSTYDQLHNEAVHKASLFLKQNWGDINTLIVATAEDTSKAYTAPAQPDFKAMATELVDKGNIQGFSIQELDHQLDKKDPKKQLKQSFGVQSLEELVPTARDLELIATSVDKHNPENQKPKDFWEGVLSFLSNIGKYLVGFFSWVASGFEGGFEGLQKQISAQFVSGMAENVRADVQAVQDSKFLSGRGGANAEMIAEGVKHKGEEKVGLRKAATETSLDEVQQGAIGSAAREAIRKKIEQQTREVTLEKFDKKVGDMNILKRGWGWATGETKAARTKVADTVARVVGEVMTDAANDNKSTDQKILLIQNQLGGELKKLGIAHLDDTTIKTIVKDTGESLSKNQDIKQLEAVFATGGVTTAAIPAMNKSLEDFNTGKFKGEETPIVPNKTQQNFASLV